MEVEGCPRLAVARAFIGGGFVVAGSWAKVGYLMARWWKASVVGLLVAAVLVTSWGSATPAAADPARVRPTDRGADRQLASVDVVPVQPGDQSTVPVDVVSAPKVVWPVGPARTHEVTVEVGAKAAAVSDTGLRIAAVSVGVSGVEGVSEAGRGQGSDVVSAGSVQTMRVRPVAQAVVERLAGPGVGYIVEGMPGSTVRVELDYAPFADAVGADWGGRLRWIAAPSCFLDTPEVKDCQQFAWLDSINDPATKTLTGEATLSGGSVVVMAAGAPTSSAGDFTATSLSSASAWAAGGSSGAFTWNYPLRTPPVPGRLGPDLVINYSSADADGRTSGSNNQPSWLGEGFDLSVGFIERRYAQCADEVGSAGANNATKTGDLCWLTDPARTNNAKWDNATLSLSGHSGELVRIGSTAVWRLIDDDGTRVEKVGAAGATSGEYWKVTTTDGMQYFFGKGASDGLPGTATNSVWKVPVAGNHAGEPAYASGFGSSFRSVAWRWNLDYVVSPDGDTMTYRYAAETNKYRQNLATTVSYDRGGYLAEVRYGERQGSETATPAAKVVFTVAERCFNDPALPNCASATPTAANAYHWPDVPVDSICTGTTCTASQTSPTFFTRKRLAQIDTFVRNSSSTYDAVDRWKVSETYPQSGDGSPNALWLSEIQHSGRAGTDIILPAVKLTPSMMVNRVTGLAYGTPLTRARLTTITLESGGKIEVGYLGSDCTASSLPTDWNNGKRCYPAYYSENGSPPTLQWFNKYLVNLVLEQDTAQVVDSNDTVSAAGAVAKRTAYTYQGTPAWRYDDSLLTPAKYRTWNSWRGFERVTATVGDSGSGLTQTVTENLFFRGMHGDKTNTSATKNITVTDSQGGTWTDHDHLAGFVRESRQLTASGGSEMEGALFDPFVSAETANDGRKAARVIDVQETRTRQTITGKPVRKSTSKVIGRDATYPWLVTQMQDTGDEAVVGDEQCAFSNYASNPTLWVIGLVYSTSTMPNLCSTPWNAAAVLDHTRTYYDGSTTLGQAPTRGLTTRIDQFTGSTTRVWATTATTAFDQYGRPTTTTNALGQTSTIAYAPASGPVTTITGTSPDPDGTGPGTPLVTTTTFDPRWGTAIKRIDPGGQTTEAVLDSLGRSTSVWLPGRAKSASASQKFSYGVNVNGVNWLKTETLRANNTYAVSYVVMDSLLRERQTQTDSRQASGRVITDQRYDSRGLPIFTSSYWDSTGAPDGKLVQPSMLVQIPSITTTTFDAAERPLVVTLSEYGYAKWNTSHAYTGDQVKVTPPAGGTPTTTTLDIHGRTTALTRHLGTSTAAAGTTTNYAYTPEGRLASITDAQGNVWSYTYDLAGNTLVNNDPDKGATTSTYDLIGNVTSVTDARGQGVKTVYDALNRPIKTTNLASTTTLTSTVWDTVKKGLLTSSTRHVSTAQIVSKVNAYDTAGRPTSSSMVVPTITNLIPSQLAGTYTTTQTYNIDGSVNTQGLPATGPVPAETLTTVYDTKGNAATLTGVSGSVTTGYVSYASYTPLGEPNIVEHGVAAGGWLGGQTFYEPSTRRVIGIDAFVDTAGGDLELGTLTYDPAGNITKTTAQQGAVTDTQCYRYDYLQQLTAAWTPASGDCAPNPTQAGLGGPAPYWNSWTADVVGNLTQRIDRTKTTSTTTNLAHPTAGQPRPHFTTSATSAGTAPGTRTYTADVAGNTATRVQGGQTQTLAWDAENKLDTITIGGSQTQKNVYDTSGNRIVRREATKTTLYSPAGEITVTHASGALATNRYYTFNGKVVALRTGTTLDKVTYLLGDHQDTTRIQVNAQTRTASTRWSAPYGTTRSTTGSWVGERAYVGGTTDATVGLVHIGARDYDTHLNQFITTDPILKPNIPATLNAYSYAYNNPTTLSDPTGLDACPDGCEEYGRLNGRGAAIDYQHEYNLSRIEQLKSGNTRSGTSTTGSGNKGTNPSAGWNRPGTQGMPQYQSPSTGGYKPIAPRIGGNWLDELQFVLDLLGLFPVIGEPADGVNAAIYAVTGNFEMAGVSASSMIPVFGIGPTLGKFAARIIPDAAANVTKSADEFVDLASTQRRTHILDGEVRTNGTFGGGHRPGNGFPGKSEFPGSWSDGRIMHEISDVATDPSLVWRAGSRPGDFFVNGTRDGVDIEVLIRNDQIWTGYPTNLPRNKR